jgi:DNA-binding FadR family transcriptional regulator
MQPNATSRRVAAEHRAIYEAIASGNEASAAERMKDHLFAGIERVFGKRSW